jgi:glycosyltransferase involved in cell wall biosynthesis
MVSKLMRLDQTLQPNKEKKSETRVTDVKPQPRVADDEQAACSVIIPVYNEADNVPSMHRALVDLAETESSVAWEFLFVEDGSSDETFATLADISRTDPRVKIVRLSRNYGSHIGAAAGLKFASGNAAVIVAGDLQDHPREISRFLAKWREGFDVVWGVRATRQDKWLDRLLSRCFATLIRLIALPNYPSRGTGSFCLVDRKVIDALNRFPEHNRMTSGLILVAGFRQTQVEYDRLQRHSGKSKWSLHRKVKLTIDTLVSFSSTPIRLASVSGITIAMVSVCYAIYLAIDTLLYGRTIEGWTTIVVLLLMVGGLQLFVLGILGEYLWRVCDDVRQRPLYLVQEIVGTFPRIQRSLETHVVNKNISTTAITDGDPIS